MNDKATLFWAWAILLSPLTVIICLGYIWHYRSEAQKAKTEAIEISHQLQTTRNELYQAQAEKLKATTPTYTTPTTNPSMHCTSDLLGGYNCF